MSDILIFKESELAHQYLDGLRGLEIGGSAHNPFGLNTKNVDYTDSLDTRCKKAEIKLCGEALAVDIIAKGDEIPVSDGSQDFIVSSHVLEHFPDTIKTLKEWYSVIRDNGYIFMIIPHKERTYDKDRPRTKLQELIERYETGKYPEYHKGHYYAWITEDILDLIDYLGWNIVDFQDIDDKVGNGFTVVVKKGEISKERKDIISNRIQKLKNKNKSIWYRIISKPKRALFAFYNRISI